MPTQDDAKSRQDNTRQGKTIQSNKIPYKTRQDNNNTITRQDQTRHDKTNNNNNKTMQYKTRQ